MPITLADDTPPPPVELDYLFDGFDGSLNELITKLEELRQQYGGDSRIEFRSHWSGTIYYLHQQP